MSMRTDREPRGWNAAVRTQRMDPGGRTNVQPSAGILMPRHVQVAIDGHRCRYQTVPRIPVRGTVRSTVQALCKHCASTVHSTGIRKKAGTIRANLGGTAGAAERIPSQNRFSVLVFLFSGHCTKEVPQWITDLQKTSKT